MTESTKRAPLWLLIVAMIFPTIMAWLYFRHLGGQAAKVNWLQQLTYSGSKVVQFTLPVLWLSLTQSRLPTLSRPRFDGLAIGIGFGLLVAIAMFGLYYGYFRDAPILTDTPAKLRNKLREFGVDTPATYAALAVFLVAAHSLLEEYYWRWFVFGQLRQWISFGSAVMLSSLAFMAHHVIILDAFFPGQFLRATLPFSLGIAVGGAVWAWLYDRTQSIWSPWLSHALVDAALFIIGWDLLQRGT